MVNYFSRTKREYHFQIHFYFYVFSQKWTIHKKHVLYTHKTCCLRYYYFFSSWRSLVFLGNFFTLQQHLLVTYCASLGFICWKCFRLDGRLQCRCIIYKPHHTRHVLGTVFCSWSFNFLGNNNKVKHNRKCCCLNFDNIVGVNHRNR